MKKLILLIPLLYSCSSEDETKNGYFENTNNGIWGSVEYRIEQKIIDSCEYIIIFGAEGRSIIHKANCKNHK